jgi:hypothetical protein
MDSYYRHLISAELTSRALLLQFAARTNSTFHRRTVQIWTCAQVEFMPGFGVRCARLQKEFEIPLQDFVLADPVPELSSEFPQKAVSISADSQVRCVVKIGYLCLLLLISLCLLVDCNFEFNE